MRHNKFESLALGSHLNVQNTKIEHELQYQSELRLPQKMFKRARSTENGPLLNRLLEEENSIHPL